MNDLRPGAVADGGLRLRSLAGPLAALLFLHVALMLAWSVVVPTFRGADEHVHHDFLRHLAETWDYPDYDELLVHRRTHSALSASPVYDAQRPAASADQAEPRDERASWTELGPDERVGPNNQLAQHPPLYYVPTATVLRVIDGDGSAPVDRVVWQLRLLSIVALAPVPLLAADIARRFTSSPAVVLTAAAFTLCIPQLTHIGATLSNDPIMILTGSVAMAGVARMLTGDRRWRTAAVTGVAAGLSLLTKGFAVPLVPVVAVAALLPLWTAFRRREPEPVPDPERATEQHRPGTRTTDHPVPDPERATEQHRSGTRTMVGGTVGRAALVAVLALVLGGWWWIRNIVVFDNPQPGVSLRERKENVDVDVLRFAGSFGKRLIDSFWGNVGWREAHLPLALSVGLTVVAIVLVVAGVWRRWERAVFLLAPAVAGFMVLAAGWGAFRKTGVSFATQGRYLYAAIAALAALAALGLARLLSRRWHRLPLGPLAVGIALQAAMLVIAVRRYWAGGGLDRIDALTAFSPLPEPASLALLALPVVAAVVALASVWRVRASPAPLDA